MENDLYYGQTYDPVNSLPQDLDLDQELVEAARERMHRMIHELDRGEIPGNVLRGSAKSVILSQAEALHADRIVVGTHSRRGITRLLGSTASAITHAARCDVLTTRIDATDWGPTWARYLTRNQLSLLCSPCLTPRPGWWTG